MDEDPALTEKMIGFPMIGLELWLVVDVAQF